MLVIPIPLAMKFPGARWVVEVFEEVFEEILLLPPLLLSLSVELDLLAKSVILTVLLAGVFDIVLVLPLTTSAVPDGSRKKVVPEIVTASPGLRVVPGPREYWVVPSTTEAENVFPFIVSAGAAVIGPFFPSVEVTPLTTTTEPEPVEGIESVVPEITRLPPGVSVCPGAITNSVVPPITVAGMTRPFTVRAGAGVMRGAFPSTWVCPFITATVPEGPKLRIVPDTIIAGPPGLSVCVPTINCPFGFAVNTSFPTVKTAGAVGPTAGFTANVLPPTTKLDPPPLAGTETTTPLIVAD